MSVFDQLVEASRYKAQAKAAAPSWEGIIGDAVGKGLELAGKASYEQAVKRKEVDDATRLKVIDNLTTGKDLINVTTGQPATTEELALVLKGFYNGEFKVSRPDSEGNVMVADAESSKMKYAFVPKQQATSTIQLNETNRKELVAMGLADASTPVGTIITRPITTINTAVGKLGQGQLDKNKMAVLKTDPQYTVMEAQYNNALKNWQTVNEQFKNGNATQAQVDEAVAEKDSAIGRFNGYVRRKYGDDMAAQLYEVIKTDKPVWYGTKTVETVSPAGGTPSAPEQPGVGAPPAPGTPLKPTTPPQKAVADPKIQAVIDDLKKKKVTVPKIKQYMREKKIDVSLYKF
jgi:hypothetical protein